MRATTIVPSLRLQVPGAAVNTHSTRSVRHTRPEEHFLRRAYNRPRPGAVDCAWLDTCSQSGGLATDGPCTSAAVSPERVRAHSLVSKNSSRMIWKPARY